MPTAKTGETRDRRWNLRVEDSEDELVRTASELTEVKFSRFVRDAAVAEARRILADRTQVPITPDRAGFVEMLDRQPHVPAGLRDLYSKPSVFE